MRLLVITQTIDRKDAPLGFFHQWVAALASRVDSILVFPLNVGEHDLPENVRIVPIRPWGYRSRLRTAFRVIRLAWKYHNEYDAVFVHMNQEYVLVAGWLWKLLGKPVYMWRNHYMGSVATSIAGMFCKKVFYTSKLSYTARFKNSVQMPVGVDVDSCHLDEEIERKPRSVLFLGRFDISKHPEMLVEALGLIAKAGGDFSASFVGGPSDPNSSFPKQVADRAAELGIADKVHFAGSVPNTETYKYYRSHAIYVNLGKSGMLDKSLFKSIACGCLAIFTSVDMGEIVGEEFRFVEGSVEGLTEKLTHALSLSTEERQVVLAVQHQSAIKGHTLSVLMDRIVAECN